jgi:hypothetical protein
MRAHDRVHEHQHSNNIDLQFSTKTSIPLSFRVNLTTMTCFTFFGCIV